MAAMPTIDDLFEAHTARSTGYDSYQAGDTAFVTNGLTNSGVLGFVTPKSGDKVFRFAGISLSAFLEATVHVPPFIGRGNGGSGLIILEPKQPISVSRLGGIAAYINSALRWRFSWYRQATVSRVKSLMIPPLNECSDGSFRVSPLLPACTAEGSIQSCLNYAPFQIDSLFELRPGDYHSLSDLPGGGGGCLLSHVET